MYVWRSCVGLCNKAVYILGQITLYGDWSDDDLCDWVILVRSLYAATLQNDDSVNNVGFLLPFNIYLLLSIMYILLSTHHIQRASRLTSCILSFHFSCVHGHWSMSLARTSICFMSFSMYCQKFLYVLLYKQRVAVRWYQVANDRCRVAMHYYPIAMVYIT